MRYDSWQPFSIPREQVLSSFYCWSITLPNTRNWGTGVWEKYVDETRHDEQIFDGRVLRTGVPRKSLVSGGAGAGAGISCSSTNTSSARPISCKKHKAIPAVFLLSVDSRRPGQRQLARHALQSENLGTKATQPPTTTEIGNPLSRGGRITSADGEEARVQKWPIKR